MKSKALFDMLKRNTRRSSQVLACVVAIFAPLCTLAISLLLRPATYQTPYLPCYPAVLAAVLVGGFRAGLFATIVSAVGVHYYFLPPYNSFETTTASVLQGCFFCLTFGFICWLIDRRKLRADFEINNGVDDLRRAQAVASIGTWRLDVRRNKLWWSEESYNIFGMTPGMPLTYESFQAAVHPQDREFVDTCWQAALKGGPYDIEHRILVNNSEKWVRETAELEFDAAGLLLGGFGAVQDITKRKHAELALKTSENRLRTILDKLPVGVWVADERGVIVFANPAAQRIWAGARYTPIEQHAEFKGWWYDTKERIEAERWALSRALRTGETTLNELVKIECFDGKRKVIYNSGVPIKNEEGRVIGAIAINEDVTERKKSEEMLIRTEKLASAGRLAATIAHEIRNPLETVRGLTYLMKTANEMPATAITRLSDIDAEIERVEDIVRNTLTPHRDSRSATQFDTVRDVRLVLDRYHSKAVRNNVSITTPGWSNSATIFGYPGDIRQVVTNLIANAIDAVEHDGIVAVRVRKFPYQGGYAVRVTVADNGYGVPASLRSKLFEPFFTTKEESGTGIGLWVTKQLIEHCGGKIHMRTATQGRLRGATFSAVFPSLPPASGISQAEASETVRDR
ncbi:MAG TPA: PAS domain S-box protein [Candidatus Saccharimonadales bacterium]|nr:PAS domain S-box protein [Candidatus Saccharimonadales bacterium]